MTDGHAGDVNRTRDATLAATLAYFQPLTVTIRWAAGPLRPVRHQHLPVVVRRELLALSQQYFVERYHLRSCGRRHDATHKAACIEGPLVTCVQVVPVQEYISVSFCVFYVVFFLNPI